MKSSLTTNSDAIIDIDSTSLGATYVKAGDVLSEEYISTHDAKYISPDGSIDASTCLFPDNVWFFHGQHHEVGRNDVVIKLIAKLASGQINSTADMADQYPQFNGNRNTRNITRWYLEEAELVFAEYEADPTLYNEADVEELRTVYEEAQELLTRCDGNLMRALVELERQGRIHTTAPGAQSSVKAHKTPDKENSFLNRALRYRLVVENKKRKVENHPEVIANLSALYCAAALLFAPHLVLCSLILCFMLGYHIHLTKRKTASFPTDMNAFVDQTVSNIKTAATSFAQSAREAAQSMEKNEDENEITIE
jgi:hypothetical protein